MLLHNNNPILFKANKQKILTQLLNSSGECQIARVEKKIENKN